MSKPTWMATIHWKTREVQYSFVDADNECEAIMNAVAKCCKSKSELYDHVKSKAVKIHD